MKISFVAGFGPLVRDKAGSLAFYRDVLGLPLVGDDDYVSMDGFDGIKHFGQWTIEDAAESIFGHHAWPADIPMPNANIEFDVESPDAVADAARELEAAGHRILVGPKTEPWNQTVVRLLGPEGMLVIITYTPWLHAPIAPETAEPM